MQFTAKTNQGTIIKCLSEILQNSLTGEIHFVFDKAGIFARNWDSKKTRYVVIGLPMERFNDYHCEVKREISVTIKHLLKILKDLKKKDEITLFIESKFPTKLRVKIISKQADETETESINVRDVYLPEYEDIESSLYNPPKILDAPKFLKICKKMVNVKANDVVISIQKNNYLRFYGDGASIFESDFVYGKLDEKKEYYEQAFIRNSITDFMKLSSLGSNIQIFSPISLANPLKISVLAGNLGTIDVFLKTKSMIEDSENAENDVVLSPEFSDFADENAKAVKEKVEVSLDAKKAKKAEKASTKASTKVIEEPVKVLKVSKKVIKK